MYFDLDVMEKYVIAKSRLAWSGGSRLLRYEEREKESVTMSGRLQCPVNPHPIPMSQRNIDNQLSIHIQNLGLLQPQQSEQQPLHGQKTQHDIVEPVRDKHHARPNHRIENEMVSCRDDCERHEGRPQRGDGPEVPVRAEPD